MSKIKVSELFYSLQGEGRFMGVPSVFLRTFGCNFKCAGFGMKPNELSTEANTVALLHKSNPFENYESLPLVSTGCDSYASWHPDFKDLSPLYTINELVDNILELLPNKEWKNEHLVITGGEPLLGWQRAFPDLLRHPKMQGLKEITFETNGTQDLTDGFSKFLLTWKRQNLNREVTFSVSAKLSCSGEPRNKAINPEIVVSYKHIGFTYLKFVIATEDDATEALEVTELYRKEGFTGPVYLMPVGGVNEIYNLNNKRVAELALANGLRYSDRLHLPLFGNSWGT